MFHIKSLWIHPWRQLYLNTKDKLFSKKLTVNDLEIETAMNSIKELSPSNKSLETLIKTIAAKILEQTEKEIAYNTLRKRIQQNTDLKEKRDQILENFK